MERIPFVHLHVHTHYSLLDGACKIPDLVSKAKGYGMEALAITDHGALFGLIEFYNECRKEGIKPILGMEAYMAPGDRRDRSTPSGNAGAAAYHLILLAQDIEGYKNLLKLSSASYREGFYYKPRIDKEILRQWSKGLIATSACLGGEIPTAFLKRDMKGARKVAETYLEILGPDRFFIEVQKQGIKVQDEVNPELAELAKKLGVGLVATNDVHFLNKDDHHAHDVLCCISMGRQITDEGRLKYPTELYLKGPEDMKGGLGAFDQAIENTARIAGMCNVELDFSKRHAPVYRVPEDMQTKAPHVHAGIRDDERYLRQLCEQGLKWRYGTTEVSKDIRLRLENELKVIAGKGFCSYFLICWDFCNFARDEGIPVGARGSAVGTMVGYLLGLCNVDPLQYNLLFERFMDPSRNEMPDIDIDICQDGRQKVIDYVRQKYGHVAQIITFGTLAAKAVCKDVGRVLGVPLGEVDKLTKLIPHTPGMTLAKALSSSPDLEKLYRENTQVKQIIDIGKKLEGLCRNAGCHAAGVIIADQPLEELIPLYKDSDGNILTQYEGPIIDKVGLLKMDFLGLRTLSTLHRSIELVKQIKGIEIDIEKIDFADKNVLAMFARGETKGIFQFESGGMQDLLMKMRPDRLGDLIAANALYRPGPMELIPLYCNRKHGRESVPQVHPIMDAILSETYGVMCYQEQVMQIFNQLGGIELSDAYKLIKAISKKLSDVIKKYRPDFMKGATSKGIAKSKAEEIFELILKFGGYGFNKSHSTRYAIIAFQTAYMKVYHPLEYMGALLTYEMGSTDKVVEYIDECRKVMLPSGTRGIRVLPPDVNVSNVDFTPVYEDKEGVIRFGLAAVKGVGTKAVEAIMAARQQGGSFASLYDFCERVDLRTANKSTLEALIKAGAFDSTGARRAQLLAVLERALEVGQQSQTDKRMGQMNMFGAAAAVTPTNTRAADVLPDIEEFKQAELLKYEKEVLGFYITSHPLTEHQQVLERYSTDSTREAALRREGAEVVIGGMITRVKKNITKNGRSAGMQMAMLTLEDLEGQIDAVVFAETLADIQKRGAIVALERIVFLKGRVDKRRETPSIIVNDIVPIEESVAKMTTAVVLKLDRQRHAPAMISEIKPVLTRNNGRIPVFVQVPANGSQIATIRLNSEACVKVSPTLQQDLECLLGSGGVQLCGVGSKRQRLVEQQRLFTDDAESAQAPPDASEAAVEVLAEE